MATSKVLQVPKILSIDGSTIRIAHPDISEYIRTRVASPITAGGTTLTVQDNRQFADNDWFILGEVSDPKTEECDVNGSVTRGTSITITNSTKFDHEVDAPVTRIFERGVKIYGASSDGGAGTLIASVDAITTPIADAVSIQWDKEFTEYTLITTDTAYAYYFVKFTDGTTDSDASDYVPAAGPAYNSAYAMIQAALRETKSSVDGDLITWEWLLDLVNDFQDEVTHYVMPDGVSKDWTFEIAEDVSSLTSVQNTEKYALSGLTSEMKYPDSEQGIIQVKLGKHELEFADLDEIEEAYDGIARTTVATQALSGDTSLVAADTYEFTESGTIYVGPDTVTYTGNTQASETFTGIPSSGSGSITATRAVGTVIWQGISPGQPKKYGVFNGSLYLDRPVSSDQANLKFKIKYLYRLARLTSLVETTVITFPHLAKHYIGSKIEKRKGNDAQSDYLRQLFEMKLEQEATKDRVNLTDQLEYYKWST